jgi:hypothetical protein
MAQPAERRRPASQMMATTTAAAMIARIQVIPVAIENAAPPLRTSWK